MNNSDYRVIPMWLWVAIAVLVGIIFANACMAQQARPTYNPFSNSGFNNNQQFYGQRPSYGFNNNQQFYGQRPNNNFNNNQQFYGQRPNNNFNSNQQFYGQRPNNNFNSGFNNNNFNNNLNNGFNNNQQQGNNQTNNPQLFTSRYHLNNGYLYGRPTLYFDAKSGKMQPWVRKNLR